MRLSRTLLTVIAIAAAGQTAHAQDLASASTTANLSISAINSISFASSVSLTIAGGTAGSGLTAATATSTYDIISNATDSKLTGVIDLDMPANSSLSVSLGAPAGATSAGSVALSSTAVDLVTGISNVSETNLPVSYTFGADVHTAASLTRTVTYVLTAGA
jgi:hypothetical protein